MAKIAIVTPVYNAAQYVKQAYECLCRQQLNDWEWMVVDDGSTDGSGDIIDAIARGDGRVTVVHEENSGNAKYPRDRAVYISKAPLILMLDADDTIDDDYLQKMVERMEETDADIVYPQMVFEQNGTCIHTLPLDSVDSDRVYEGREVVRLTIPDWQIGCNGGLYRRQVWVNMSYPHYEGKILMNTDELDERLYQIEARRVAFAKTRYHYRIHSQATTKKVSRKKFDVLETNAQLKNIIEKEYGKKSLEYRLMKNKIWNDRQYALRLMLSMIKQYIINMLHQSKRFRWYVDFPYNQRKCMNVVSEYYHHEDSDGDEKSNGEGVKEVVCVCDAKLKMGGITDRLRGIVSTYMACKDLQLPLRIYFEEPFRLEDYLVPATFDWHINADEISYSMKDARPLCLEVIDNTLYQKRKISKLMRSEIIKTKKRQLHVYTDSHACYIDGSYGKGFREVFKPSDRLRQRIETVKAEIGGRYVSVSTRFQQLLNDFSDCGGNVLDDNKRQQLIVKVMERLEMIHRQLPKDYTILCASDSMTFLKEVKKLPYVYVIPGSVVHTDYCDKPSYEDFEKVFLDMLLIADAEQIFLLQTDKMYGSGFPYAASMINNRPFHHIVF